MDMDVLTALLLAGVGLVMLWVLIIRKRYSFEERLARAGVFPLESASEIAHGHPVKQGSDQDSGNSASTNTSTF